MRNLAISVLAATLLAAAASPARAECYDVYGCTDRNYFDVRTLLSPGPTCEFLYTMRNSIYAEHGYCFQSPRAIAAFGNANCRTSNPNALGFNRYESANASTILRAEQSMGCPE